MSFRDRLKKKISIDVLTHKIIGSLKDPESGINFDKQLVRQLMEISSCRHVKERDLELYVLEDKSSNCRTSECTILVLDNALPIYRTTFDDVLMRKDPSVKEMVNIRNAIKILNDKDVVVSRKAESVETIRRMLIDDLDLNYDSHDIDRMTVEGINAVENRDTEDVADIIQLFAELLTLDPLPKAFHADNRDIVIVGRLRSTPPSGYEAESIVIYDGRSNALKFLRGPLNTNDIDDMQRIDLLFKNEEQADLEGGAVFDVLRQRVIREKPVVN